MCPESQHAPGVPGVKFLAESRSRTEELMLKQVLVIAAAGALILAAGHAASPDSQIIIPAHQTNPTDGQQMFVSYCAPCHGADGRGSGPVAGALKARPSDLTLLTKNNQGKYPDSHVYTVLEFGSAVPAH